MRSTSHTLFLSAIAVLVMGFVADRASTTLAEGPNYPHLKPIESLVGRWEMQGKGADSLPDLDITFTRIKFANPEAIPTKALAAMRYFVGNWEGDVFLNGERIGSSNGVRKWLPGRYALSIVQTGKENDADVHSSGITGWDAKEKQLVEQWHTLSGLSATCFLFATSTLGQSGQTVDHLRNCDAFSGSETLSKHVGWNKRRER